MNKIFTTGLAVMLFAGCSGSMKILTRSALNHSPEHPTKIIRCS